MQKNIKIREASENNLKSINLDIPHHCMVVVTGVSGSGKSSLAYDIIYQEGQRLYLGTISSYARQFIGKLKRPEVRHIEGIFPTISLDQKRITKNPRSTVGTLSEIYDYLRLLFARCGVASNDLNGLKQERRLFSFNSSYGACPECNGLGIQERIDEELLLNDKSKSIRERVLNITAPNGYIIYSQVTMDVLNQVCEANGFNVDIPWCDLTEEQKHIVLYGSDKIKIPYGKHTLESRMKWSGITAKPREEGFYKGIIPVMDGILKRDRNANILRFAAAKTCESCEGKRLRNEALSVLYKNKSIDELTIMSINQLDDFFTNIKCDSETEEIVKNNIFKKTKILKQLGIGYLTSDRESTTLSGGEGQRIRLVNLSNTNQRNVLYLFDEPSIGMHPKDVKNLISIFRDLVEKGNSVIIIEHEEEIIRNADWLIDIGPYSGVNGGEVLFNGPINGFLKKDKNNKIGSKTLDFLTGKECIEIPKKRRTGKGDNIIISGAKKNNLKNINTEFLNGAFNVVTGVSGAGKSSLVRDTLANFLKNKLNKSNQNIGSFDSIKGIDKIDKIIEIDQSPIGKTPRSNPATYTKLFDHIRNLFASLEESKKRKWNKGRFSFNVKGGRCETCQGAGVTEVGMHYMGNVELLCDDCNGKRFNDETLEVKYKGKSIYDILEMPVNEALDFFSNHKNITNIIKTIYDLGLGYISLGQSSTTLSGGEAQRIKLASELARPSTSNTIYILDEPSIGLHFYDLKILLKSLDQLVEKGNTVILIEHNTDIIKVADHIIDLGSESGPDGGQIVFSGKPEDIIDCKDSHTGKALKTIFEKKDIVNPNNKAKVEIGSFDNPMKFKGISTHNLKNIDIEIPVNKTTVLTGISGSGKSSLAFDTIFSECRNSFTENLSTYVRSFMHKTTKADFESCSDIMPAIAVRQSPLGQNPRSTVGTASGIYDFYRLMFARAGKSHCINCKTELKNGICIKCDKKYSFPLSSNMFSFNSEAGACTECKGLGYIKSCDPDKFVSDPQLSLLDGALKGNKPGKFYGDPFGQYLSILKKVGEVMNIDFSKAWNKLSEEEQNIAMYGTSDKEYDVDWIFKRKNREGVHKFKGKWQGFVAYVDEEYERKHADKRAQAIEPIMKQINCPSCNGLRLKDEILNITINKLNISELCSLNISKSIVFFENKNETETIEAKNIADLKNEILDKLYSLKKMGLEYISINRNVNTLSGGESKRLQLATYMAGGLNGITYILDEPTAGLHSKDTKYLIEGIKKLKSNDNTIIIVEHDVEIIRNADNIIEIGPEAGNNGGEIVAKGSLEDILKREDSKTAKFLNSDSEYFREINTERSGNKISIKGADIHNLKNINIDIPVGKLVSFSGVSGSGKSSLVFDVLAASAESSKAIGCKSINGIDQFDNIIKVDQKNTGFSSLSSPASLTGILDLLKNIFAATEYAKNNSLKKNAFSYNSKEGACPTCKGAGKLKTSLDFLEDIWSVCEDCKGLRYKDNILECIYKGKNIADIFDMTIDQALEFFSDQNKITGKLNILKKTGLSYLKLGQAANTLSGGEVQRLKLCVELLKSNSNKNLYLFDEPTTGLHYEDIKKLIILFDELVKQGHSVIVIEHNLYILRNSDWIIDMGPEGGEKGGRNIVEGTVEKIMKCKKSHTGVALS